MARAITHNYVLQTGKYKGQYITRVPAKYLSFLIASPTIPEELQELAEIELERRNSYVPKDIFLSGHAIDQASLRLADLWTSSRNKKEGIYSWLAKFAEKALAKGTTTKDGIYAFRGVLFVFTEDKDCPVLKTVMKNAKGKK